MNFNIYKLVLLFSLYLTIAFANENNNPEFPFSGKKSFKNIESMKKWCGTSSFGGGILSILKIYDREIYIVDRSFTSGFNSSEVGVYIWDGNVFTLRYSIPIQHRYYHKYKIINDQLIITRINEMSETKVTKLSDKQLFGF